MFLSGRTGRVAHSDGPMGLVFYVRCVLRRTKASLIPNPSRKRSVRNRALATMLGKKYDHRGLKNTSDKSVDISGYCCVYFFLLLF